jgi:hypothetical protein
LKTPSTPPGEAGARYRTKQPGKKAEIEVDAPAERPLEVEREIDAHTGTVHVLPCLPSGELGRTTLD